MSDFTFLYPYWLLALFPVAALIFWLMGRTHNQTLIAPHLAKAMGVQVSKHGKRLVIVVAWTWIISIIALAGPSFQKAERPSFSSTSARVLVMDMSMSMYATDIKPNRLTQERYKAIDLLQQWKEGNTGLVAYAGDAYTISPLTSDSQTIRNHLPNLSPELMPYPGANAASGVELAITMMQNAGLATGDIVLMTDDIDDNEQSDIADLLKGTDWGLSILGIGTRDGAPIQLPDGSLMKSNSGITIIAKTNFNNMRKLASDVGGFFTPIQHNSNDVNAIASRTSGINTSTEKNNDQKIEESVNNGYPLVLLLLIPALFMFRKGIMFSLLVLVLPTITPPPASATPWLTNDQQAMRLFDSQEFDVAADMFENNEWQGIAQYKAGNYEGAIESLSRIETPRGKYNLANAYAQQHDFDSAIALYEEVLKQDPDNQDAKHNLDLVKEQKKQQEQGEQSDSGEQSDQQDQGQQSDQQNQDGQKDDAQEQQNNEQSKDGSQNQPSSELNDEASQDPSQSDQQPDENQSPSEDDVNSSEQQDADKQKAEQQDASQPSSESEKSEEPQEGEDNQVAASGTQEDNQQHVDPDLRKLEQVENVRDPTLLLRNQLILQARQKQSPQRTGKQW